MAADNRIFKNVEAIKEEIGFNERLTDYFMRRHRVARVVDGEVSAELRSIIFRIVKDPINPEIAAIVSDQDPRAGHTNMRHQNKPHFGIVSDELEVLVRELLTRLYEYKPDGIGNRIWLRQKVEGVKRMIDRCHHDLIAELDE